MNELLAGVGEQTNKLIKILNLGLVDDMEDLLIKYGAIDDRYYDLRLIIINKIIKDTGTRL